MAITTQNTYTGNGTLVQFSFTFPYLDEAEVKVSLDGVDVATSEYSLANATTVEFNTAPTSGQAIRIYRETDVEELQATFFSGSAIRAQDLNDNFNQVFYSTQETVDRRLDRTGGTMTGDIIMDDSDIVFEGATDDEFETTLTVVDPTADRTITLPDVTGTVVTTGDTGTVATGMVADSAITTAKIADSNVTTAKIANSNVTTAKIADSNVTTAKINDSAVTTAKLNDSGVTTAKIADANVTTAKIADSNVTTAKIADANVTTAKIATDAIDGTKLADNAVDSEHYTDGSIDRVHLAADIVDGTKIADDSIDSEHYVDQSIDAAHLATDSVTTGKIAADAITNAKIANNAVQAENINGLTATIAELNQLDGNTLSNAGVDWTSGTTFPSANQISARLEAFGGFEAIADDESFPNTAPEEGVIISIANAGGLVVNASGTSTNGDTLDDTAVTINNFPSGFHSTTLDDGIGLLVVATATDHTYNFHRVVAKDEDVRQLSSDIDDFKARYRVGGTNPTTDLDEGDLFYNTGSDTMLVYDGSAWTEVQSIGEYFIIPASDFPTWNGTINDISITSNAPANAEQIILSINGVIQEPNSGTARPTDGFSLNGSTIQLSDPPATGSDAWGVIIGSTVNIGTPSAGTVGTTQLADGGVTTAKIAADAVNGTKIADDSIDSEHYVDGSIDNVHVSASAAIAGTKISPDFGAQDLTVDTNVLHVDATNDRVGVGTSSPARPLDIVSDSGARAIQVRGRSSDNIGLIDFYSNDGATRYATIGAPAASQFAIETGNTERVRIDSSGNVGIGTTSPAGANGKALTVYASDYPRLRLINDATGTASGDGAGLFMNSDDLYVSNEESGGQILFRTAASEQARIDSSGRLLVGTSTSLSGGGSQYSRIQNIGNSSGSPSPGYTAIGRSEVVTSMSNNDRIGRITFTDNAAADFARIEAYVDGTPGTDDYPGRLVFSTTKNGQSSPTERVRITEAGFFKVSNTGGYVSSTSLQHEIRSDTNNAVLKVTNDRSAYGDAILVSEFTNAAPNDASARFLYCGDTSAQRCSIRSNGGIANFQSNDANLCDEREKKNIETLDSTWGCLKNWDLKKFHYNEDADTDDKRYGVIAQQVAEHCPEVITDWVKQEAKDAELDEDGNVVTPAVEEIVRMGVKEQQMMWMAIKALQEAQTRIETLETANASLEARLTALEGGN